MEAESNDDLRETKILKTSAADYRSGTLSTGSNNVQPPPPPRPLSTDLIDLHPLILMIGEYCGLDISLSRIFGKAYEGDPRYDKEYLFLFCELKGVPENYEKVLADMNTIEMWNSQPSTLVFKLITSSKEPLPKSLVLAKQIVAEHKLKKIGIVLMLDCLKDLYSEWAMHQKLLGYKKYEEFLLDFWKQNQRKPEPDEISRSFCTGTTCAVSVGKWSKACPVSKCDQPGPGKHCFGMTSLDFEDLGKIFFKWLCEEGSVEDGLKKIEETYKTRSSKPWKCRATYLNAKFGEARKTGLSEKMERLIPSLGDLTVRAVDMDLSKVGINAPVPSVSC